MKITAKYVMLILSIVLVLNIAKAQETSILRDSIYSQVLHEQRQVKILLPEEYQPGLDANYDVVYVLDGETFFDTFAFLYQFARNEQLLPPMILVGVPNTYTEKGSMRARDFLPATIPGNDQVGGATNFIAFFKNELIPFIDTKFPTSGNNSLYGHSLGGLFTFYVLLQAPGLFTSYYCVDPAFPWNNRQIITMATETFKNINELHKTLWIAGVQETYRNVGIQKMDSVLKAFAPERLHWKTAIYPDETHMSVCLKGIYDGLKYTYDGFNSRKLVEFHPNNGSLLAGKPVPVFLNGSFPNVFYTLDGSEPDTSSKRAPQMIEITGPTELRVKWIGENEKYITTATGHFKISPVWPALRHVKDLKGGGVRYSYYEGKWTTLPDFTKLHAIKAGIADSVFSLEKFPIQSNFGCVFEGYLKIEQEGYYTFALCSSDGSKFILNGSEIINNDGLHGNEWYKSYVVPLQKGFYPVRLEYFQRENPRYLNLIYLSPNTHDTVNLTFQKMYH